MTDDPAAVQDATIATDYSASLANAPSAVRSTSTALRAAMGGPLPDGPDRPGRRSSRQLAAAADPGLVASAGPTFLRFRHRRQPAGGARGRLADQPRGTRTRACTSSSPAAAVAEEVAAGWLVELLGLPGGTSVGFATGATMANFTALAAARRAVLGCGRLGRRASRSAGRAAGHRRDPRRDHVTVYASLQMLGLGREGDRVRRDRGRRPGPDAARRAPRGARHIDGPVIVCAQAGNVNTGAFDPFDEIDAPRPRPGAWLHVDGAFGIWAAAVPALRDRWPVTTARTPGRPMPTSG